MATSLPSVDSREVVRCDQCLLVQFSPKNLSSPCRRCRVPLDFDANPEPPPAPEPKPAFVAAPDLSAQLAANIRTVRLSHGMSQRQVAARMGTPRTYLSKCERGDVTPTLSSLARLAAALDVSIPDLVSRDDHGRERENRIGELLADEFIGGLAEYVPKLGELQMRQVLAEVNRLALRPAA